MGPSISIDRMLKETQAPTVAVGTASEGAKGSDADSDSLNVLTSLFKTRGHELLTL